MITRATIISALLLGCSACTTELPPIDPTSFACVNDEPASDGLFQCPVSHYCDEGACAPRLGCFEPDSSVPGCQENRRRCDLRTSLAVSAATCVSGLHTQTSTPVRDRDDCPCPDGLHCVGLAHVKTASTPDAPPLYLFPTTLRPARLPAAQLGAVGELPYARMCVRVCSSELDCPAGHTCRATAVLEPSTIAGTDQGRHTIGACFPDILTTTSTPSEQHRDPTVCRARVDCVAGGRPDVDCVARIDSVPDHPARPAGAGWATHFAIVPHCASSAGTGIPEGGGCTEDGACQTGVCLSQRCARICDPSLPASCAFPRVCADTLVTRTVAGAKIYDRVFICGGG